MDKKIRIKLKALQDAFFKGLPHKITQLEEQWQNTNIHFNKENIINLHRMVHSLKGTSETYEYLVLSEPLRDLEIYLKQLINYKEINATHINDVSHLIEKIKVYVFNSKTPIAYKPLESFNKIISSRLIIYLVVKKTKLHQTLKKNLKQQGFQLRLLKTIDEFQEVIKNHLPIGIIIDEDYLDDQNIKSITNFRQKYELPLMCVTRDDDLSIRLKAIRINVSIFFDQSMDDQFITMQIVKRCALVVKEDYRILVLEDSEPIANYYALLLQEAGMNALTLNNPMELMLTLQEFNPNVLLMDLYLPECSGLELAMLIRQEERYMSLPIIFISTENDRYKQLAILNECGGDDFLTKPILPENLIAAVKSRAQRSALLHSYIIHDSLTKLLNHSFFLRQLDIEILRTRRRNESISFAMIDLDHFKQINDTHGHPMGDIVLKTIAKILSTKIRKTDFIGRYGGEEIAIIFPDTPLDRAVIICDDLREAVSSYLFNKAGQHGFKVTLSVGLASYPEFQSTSSLIAAADKALYQAKSKGRNQVKFTHLKT